MEQSDLVSSVPKHKTAQHLDVKTIIYDARHSKGFTLPSAFHVHLTSSLLKNSNPKLGGEKKLTD